MPNLAENRLIYAALAVLALGSGNPQSWAADSDPALDPKFSTVDKNAIIITNIVSWNSPAKKVIESNKMQLTKVELMWGKTFTVFHVASLLADPQSNAARQYFFPILNKILVSNERKSYEIISDDYHEGFLVLWDIKKKAVEERLILDDNEK